VGWRFIGARRAAARAEKSGPWALVVGELGPWVWPWALVVGEEGETPVGVVASAPSSGSGIGDDVAE
jgi:hypothetical protein